MKKQLRFSQKNCRIESQTEKSRQTKIHFIMRPESRHMKSKMMDSDKFISNVP